MEAWDDDELVLPSGKLQLHTSESDCSGSNSTSALFSDDRRHATDTDDDELDWAGDFERKAALLNARAEAATDDDGFDEEKGGTIKALPPTLLAQATLKASTGAPVRLLGTTAALEVGDDWFGDLEAPADGAFKLVPRPPVSGTFGLPSLSPPPSSSEQRIAKSSVSSLASHIETGDEADFEADFEIPEDLARVSLNASAGLPTLPRHDRQASSASSQGSFSPPPLRRALGQPVQRSAGGPSSGSARSVPSARRAAQSSDGGFSDDAGELGFFDDIVLPDFFGGAAAQSRKVNLQELLASKLSARAATAQADAGSDAADTRHSQHVERPTEAAEHGLVVADELELSGRFSPPAATRPRPVTRSSGRTTFVEPALPPRTNSPRMSSPLPSTSKAPTRSRSVVFSAASSGLSRSIGHGSPPSSPPSSSRTQPSTRRLGRQSPLPPSSMPPPPVPAASGRRLGAPRQPLPSIATTISPAPTATRHSSLRHKKSTPLLQAAYAAPPPIPGLSRKRSMPSLSDVGAVPRARTVTQPVRSVSPSGSPTYASPTAASSSRARVQTLPTTPLSAIHGSPSLRELAGASAARPTTPTQAVRSTLTTLSSRAKVRHMSSASDPSGRTSLALGTRTASTTPQVVNRPKRARTYGDGTELDAFDDLPVNKEHERRFTAEPVRRNSGGVAVTPRSAVSQRRVASERTRPVDPVARRHRADSKPRAQPQLIRNLSSVPVARSAFARSRSLLSTVDDSGMRWNAQAMRWEGNEGEVKAFDHVMQSSVRPALITNFAPVARSPSAVTSPTSSLASSGLSHGVGGVRIVGDMIFDPVRMSWHPVNPSAAAAEDDFDFGDDEADAALGAAAESETGRLKPKASFFALSATSDTPGADGTPAERAFWAECVAAETRHAEEMRPWSHRRTLLNAADPHAYLYDIRKIVLGS